MTVKLLLLGIIWNDWNDCMGVTLMLTLIWLAAIQKERIGTDVLKDRNGNDVGICSDTMTVKLLYLA